MFDLNAAEWRYVLDMYRLLRTGMQGRADFPTLIEVQTVNRCNATCGVCPYPYTIGEQPRRAMSDETFDRLLAECAREPAFQVMVLAFQNEPFLDRGLVDKARRFKALMPDKWLEVVTNGSPLTEALLPEVYEHFDLVSLSVNAHSADVYESVMRGLKWERMQALLRTIAARPAWRDKTILRFIRQKANMHQMHAFKRHWNREGFRVFHYDINDRLGDLRDFGAQDLPMTLARRTRLGTLKLLSRALSKTCPIPFQSFYVRADGSAVLCFCDYTEQRLLGSVERSSIREIYHDAPYRRIREAALRGGGDVPEPCSRCILHKEGIWLTV